MKIRIILVCLVCLMAAACSRAPSNNFAYLTLSIDKEVHGTSVDITYNPSELTFLGTAALQPGVVASNSQNGVIRVALINSEPIKGALLNVAFATTAGSVVAEPQVSQSVGILDEGEVALSVNTEWVTGLPNRPVTDVESQESIDQTELESMNATGAGVEASFANFPLGDFNQNGEIDIADAVAVLKVHVGALPFETLPAYRKYHSDIQCDGGVEIAEAVRVLRKEVEVVFPAQAQICPREVKIEGNQEPIVLIGNLGTEKLPAIQPDAYEGLNITGSTVGGSGPLVNLVFKRTQEGASTFTVRDVKLSRNLEVMPVAGGQLAVPGNKPSVSQLALIPSLSTCAEVSLGQECTVRIDLVNNEATDQWEGYSFIIENSKFELVRAEGTGIGASCSPQLGARVGAACAANFSGGGSVSDMPGRAYKLTRTSDKGSSGNLKFHIGESEVLVPIVIAPVTSPIVPPTETYCPDGSKAINGECPVPPGNGGVTPPPTSDILRKKIAQWGDPFSPRLTCVKWATGSFFGKKWKVCVGHKYQFLQIELFLVVKGPTAIPDIPKMVDDCVAVALTASGVTFVGTPSPELGARITAALAVIKPTFMTCITTKGIDSVLKDSFEIRIDKRSFWP